MAKYSLKEVLSNKAEKDFLTVPLGIYKDDKNWVRPLDNDIKRIFKPESNELYNNGDAIRWVAYDEKGCAVGRIAAFYNWSLVERDEVKSGGCGFFESIDEEEVAFMLFDAAVAWLTTKGFQAVDGPINFGSREHFWGLLVDGYHPPMYNMNYNPAYYQSFFEDYGFQNYFNQHTYIKEVSMKGDLNDMVQEKYRRLTESGEFEFRPITKSDYPHLSDQFREIFNKGWSKFSGVAEMTKEETDSLFKQIRPIMDNRLIFFAYHNGKAIGFVVMVPNIYDIIKHLNGKFNFWSKLKFLYHLKIKKSCHTVNAMVIGVDPDFQGKGIESGMIEAVRLHLGDSKQYKHIELIWIGDFNPLMMRVAESYIRARRFKRHITYRYMIDKTIEFKRCPKVNMTRKSVAPSE